MNPIAIGTLVFACAFAGALGGMKLGAALPPHHRGDASKDTIKLGIGLIATMTALVLGLVTASAKTSFDTVDQAIRNASSTILSLDRTLTRYGPEAAPIRVHLKAAVASRIAATWPQGDAHSLGFDPFEAARQVEHIASEIRALTPRDEDQRALQARASAMAESLLEVRFQVFGRLGHSVQGAFLAILLFWLTVTFASFGLFAPRNATVVAVLLVCAVSVAAAVFLILEMDGPFQGLLVVSPDPLLFALRHLGQ